ncbi:MAG: SAM-dependent methyltransferase [Akkermansiaceae bacterium]
MKLDINDWLENDRIPDSLIRFGIRKRLLKTLEKVRPENCEDRQAALIKHVNELKSSPLAIATDEANEQHYELPTKFFQGCLGPHLKYSSGYWADGETSSDIEASEARMLKLTCERADITDGHRILELGCGWGSLTLWMAKHFPNSEITVISNSNSQREFINSQLEERGLNNVTVKTINMIDYRGEGDSIFDRVVSVEMFEHMKNYQLLLTRISEWLKPDGKLFVHIFTHKDTSYHYEIESEDDWMSRYFFTGGQMPSDDLLLYFQDHLSIEDHWQVNGTHYERTSNAWLYLMDKNKQQLFPLVEETYGKDQAVKWWVYWRCFYMACAELWGFRNGEEWFVSHYRFTNKK